MKLMSETHSSGTMTEGTIKIGDVSEDSQFEPTFTLARPAGMAAHAWGNFAISNSSRFAHTASGTSISSSLLRP
jgi:hypothetical protein